MEVQIMDTTLRDGEQTSGVSFTASEKLAIAQLLLLDLKVDRIEVASARVSEGEFKGAKKILDWANQKGLAHKVEVLGFVDGDISLNWIKNAGGQVINLLCKGSSKHCEDQLRKNRLEHLEDIKKTISKAREMGITVNIYLEDWSNGMRDSVDYVHFIINGLSTQEVNRIMLPDTLGVLNPEESYAFCKQMVDMHPHASFDFHAHNDYDLSVANTFSAVKAGINGVHTTLNGLGERAGNAPLSSVISVLTDHLGCKLNLDESKLYRISKTVESFSGVRIPVNKPIIGELAFTQTSGIHADGDNKNKLYQNTLKPERFGRNYSYALGKMSGKSSIMKNLEEIGLSASFTTEEIKRVTARVIELGDRKETVTSGDLPFIIYDVLGTRTLDEKVKIKNYTLSVAHGLRSSATLLIEIEGKTYQETSSGDGQYDAFMNAIKRIYKGLGHDLPKLADYIVTIPPGGKTDALVITTITWGNEKQFKTKGLDSDQTISAIKATVNMLNSMWVKWASKT